MEKQQARYSRPRQNRCTKAKKTACQRNAKKLWLDISRG